MGQAVDGTLPACARAQCSFVALGLTAPAFAQAVRPVPVFVIDVRGFTRRARR